MAHLLDEHQPKGLKDLMVSVLGWNNTVTVEKQRKNPEYTGRGCGVPRMLPYTVEVPAEAHDIKKAQEFVQKRDNLDCTPSEVGYHLLPRGVMVPYAIADAVATAKICTALHAKVLADPDLAALYAQEMELTRVLLAMERQGMQVDLPYVDTMKVRYRRAVLAHEGLIEQIVGKELRTGQIPAKERDQFWNPQSKDDIADFFTNVEGYRRPSYDKTTLKVIEHPLAAELLAYRKDAKILGTYLEPLAAETGADSIFHMSSRQHGTVSGRTSNGQERGDQ